MDRSALLAKLNEILAWEYAGLIQLEMLLKKGELVLGKTTKPTAQTRAS